MPCDIMKKEETVMGMLQERLTHLKEGFEKKAPAELVAVMHRVPEDLRRSGIMERVLKPGDKAPLFTLPNAMGVMVSAADLLKKGPLVIAFYRGVW